MQWGHIKTLFILSFLILNIYLVIQFVDKQQDVGVLDNSESSLEDQLEAENITVEGIDTDVTESTYISVSQKSFSEEEKNQLMNLDGQTAAVIGNEFILSQFEEPIPIPDEAKTDSISEMVKRNIIYPEEYVFWDWNEELNVLLFFQKKEDQTVYYNQQGILLVYLNEDNEMTNYTQTMLGESEPQGNLVTIIPPMQAIEKLYDRGDLLPNDTVKDATIGYYSRILSDGMQVFAPTWKITIEGEETKDHFVNAAEGLVYPSDDVEFLQETMTDNVSKINVLPEDNEIKSQVLAVLNQRLEIINGVN